MDMTMATLILIIPAFLLCNRATVAYDSTPLLPDYYKQSCPSAEKIVREQMEIEVRTDPGIAAGLLRLHFHDCFVLGCDASILLDDDAAAGIVSEKKAAPNLNSIRGFEVVDKIKILLEKACPLTISCADLLAIVARDAVNLRGGPYWKLELGRRDSLTASFDGANQSISPPNSTLEMLISNFAAHGLSPRDLAALSGGHTIGSCRCVSFKPRIYAPAGGDDHRRFTGFRRVLRSICPKQGRDTARVPLDYKTFSYFDNQYFKNLIEGKALLQSDNALVAEDTEGEVVKHVWRFAADQHRFFREFAASMVRMGRINPLVGDQGQIRRNCRVVNA